eukprot:1376955-Pyramimonas_sp.AAC.1
MQELHGLRAGRVQTVALACARRTVVLNVRKDFTDWERAVFKTPQGLHGLRAPHFSKCGSRLSVAHTRLQQLQEFHGLPSPTRQQWRFERVLDYAGAALMLVRCVRVPGVAFQHDSGLSRRDSQINQWRANPENT